MSVDIQHLFNTKLPKTFAEDPQQAKSLRKKIQLDLTGEGGGRWMIDGSSAVPTVSEGQPGGEDARITMGAADFQKGYDDDAAFQRLYFDGKMRVSGDPMAAAWMGKLMELCRK
ncbi:hypothetical protein GCM10018980_71180 [Streptomyces capoamus]|uniref:SCP2 domain-containing protein n=1 Tax=Streptomyces capoamus TaxID=68183 RepID=A0A919F3C5_9ACTN|nr:SCP2 sterol-binding domain-containing protein [Streptomyces capoamus]GGW13249.1 hypothetical protein GCM10010501_16050 [Streptomyces libani subsp. rufus]GHG74350.1 hypothetical protein GCM10018980_71180 [Streptomyces capoamus]